MFVYHMCSDDIRGTTLYPLKALATRFPDVYARERPKYAGREEVLDFRVPHLDVAWGDTVNLAAIDPRRLVAARRRLGVAFSKLLQRRVVRIPVDRIAGSAAAVYDSRTHWINSAPGDATVASEPPAEEFSPFDATTYQELTEVPRRHLDYLAGQLARGRPALGFVFIRHVLVAGSVDIAGLELAALG